MPADTLFHVYVLRDPRTDQPIYVGMGKGRRARRHQKKTENVLLAQVFDELYAARLQPTLKIVASFAVEDDAFRMEVELIARYGRRDLNLGTLYNLTDGGKGVPGSLAVVESLQRLHADPVFAEAHSARGREQHAPRLNTTEGRAASAERLRQIQARPDVKKACSERAALRNRDPEFKARVAATRAKKRAARLP